MVSFTPVRWDYANIEIVTTTSKLSMVANAFWSQAFSPLITSSNVERIQASSSTMSQQDIGRFLCQLARMGRKCSIQAQSILALAKRTSSGRREVFPALPSSLSFLYRSRVRELAAIGCGGIGKAISARSGSGNNVSVKFHLEL
jgi:hypothetical protein